LDYQSIETAKTAIITILSNDVTLNAVVPDNQIYNTDWAFRTANLFPGISVEANRRLAGSFSTGIKELIIEFKIRCYSEQFEVSESIAQATMITNRVAEVLEKAANVTLNNTVTDTEIMEINYNAERAGGSVKSVSWMCEITFNVQIFVTRG